MYQEGTFSVETYVACFVHALNFNGQYNAFDSFNVEICINIDLYLYISYIFELLFS